MGELGFSRWQRRTNLAIYRTAPTTWARSVGGIGAKFGAKKAAAGAAPLHDLDMSGQTRARAAVATASIGAALLAGLFGAGVAGGAEPQKIDHLDKHTAKAAAEEWARRQCRFVRPCVGFRLQNLRITGEMRAKVETRLTIRTPELGRVSCVDQIDVWIDRSGERVRADAALGGSGRCPYLPTGLARDIATDLAAADCAEMEGCRGSGVLGISRRVDYHSDPRRLHGRIFVDAVVEGSSIRCEREFEVEMNRRWATIASRFLSEPKCIS